MADDLTLELEHGRLTISRDVVAEIVAETRRALLRRRRPRRPASRIGRMLRRDGVTVGGDAPALRIGLHVVVEHGLNLAEVAATVRSQVAYEVERLTGLTVAAVEVVVQRRQAERMRTRVRRARRAARWPRSRRIAARIDDLNVYPVPDGDTGTNLTLTVRAVVEALEADGPDDRAGLAREVSRAALMGARGNSGVILSQIVRGATEALAEARRPRTRVPLGVRRRLPRRDASRSRGRC